MSHLDLSAYKPQNNATSDANAIDNAFDAIVAFVNTLSDNIAAFTSAPTGSMVPHAASAAPTGWLACDGSAVSRTTYAALFAVIGTTYGAGDGSTTFNLPDMRGRVAAGYAASGGHADVSTLGANDGQAAANRRPKHRTTNNLTGGTTSGPSIGVVETFGGANAMAGGTLGIDLKQGHTHTVPAPGGSIGTNNANDALDTPSYLVLNYVIKT